MGARRKRPMIRGAYRQDRERCQVMTCQIERKFGPRPVCITHWRQCNRVTRANWWDAYMRGSTLTDLTQEIVKEAEEYERQEGGDQATRTRARDQLRAAVRRGAVTKPTTCTNCGKGGQLDGHHTDYSKPLEVEWLCRSCHHTADKIREER